MMALASSVLVWLFGNGLKIVTVPALAIGLLVAVHQAVIAHDERVASGATRLCDAKWEAGIRRQERNIAEHKARAMERILTSERQTNGELRDEIERVRKEADEVRATVASGSQRVGNNCLSDGVLDALRKKK